MVLIYLLTDMISIQEIKLPFNHNPKDLQNKIAEILDLNFADVKNFTITKRAIDSRQKHKMIYFVYSVNVQIDADKSLSPLKKGIKEQYRIAIKEPYIYEIPKIKKEKIKQRPIIVGTGPCGMFAGLLLAKAGSKPIIIEQGQDVDTRVKDVENFLKTGKLNTESNIQFGEGGAGTFSDGKLNTLITNPRINYIFSEFVKAGAPANILWDAKPHIGTDKIRIVSKNIRKEIITLGGEVHFNTKLTDLKINKNKLTGIILNNNEEIATDTLILAIGYSARDTYEMLYRNQLDIEQKPFAIGVRIEHKADMINKSQYDKFYQEKKLGMARYKLVSHSEKNRSVYTFCMCPGGYVVPATTEKNCVVINGMSEYAQDGENSNSALLVNVNEKDFASHHPLAGVAFQKKWEQKTFEVGGGNFSAPIQLVGDFLKNKKSTAIKNIKPTYQPGTTLASLKDCLPDFVVSSLQEALPKLDKKIAGFAHPEAILTAIESRSSSPLRLTRDPKTWQSNIAGIYPAGEGAGYAGGIVSSAVDGIMVSEAILNNYK